jgi:hypothetical protein
VAEAGKYRVKFIGRPDLDSDDFTDFVGKAAPGETFLHEHDTERTEWRIITVVRGEEGERDLLVCERVS